MQHFAYFSSNPDDTYSTNNSELSDRVFRVADKIRAFRKHAEPVEKDPLSFKITIT